MSPEDTAQVHGVSVPADAARPQDVYYQRPRPEIQRLVPMTARRVLDLGCSNGALGAALKERGDVEVVGLELDDVYAGQAERRLDRVLVGDLEALLGDAELVAGLGSFDCVIAADVLEHLKDPWTALSRAAARLVPGGRAIVSVPNIRHWTTFAELAVRGRWPRRDWGIFDRTHLRWFTRDDARELLTSAGLEVVEESRLYWLREGGFLARHEQLVDRAPLRPFRVRQYVMAGVR
jgi:methionine biosynthesis protein MetW